MTARRIEALVEQLDDNVGRARTALLYAIAQAAPVDDCGTHLDPLVELAQVLRDIDFDLRELRTSARELPTVLISVVANADSGGAS